MKNTLRPLFSMSKIITPILCLVLITGTAAVLSGCSGGAGSGGESASSAQVDTKFLTDGAWECTGVVSSSDGKVHELNDVMNAYIMRLNFFDDECRIYVDTNFTIVKWELSGDDITLSGDGTYHITVQDDGAKLVWKNFQDTGYDLEFAKE